MKPFSGNTPLLYFYTVLTGLILMISGCTFMQPEDDTWVLELGEKRISLGEYKDAYEMAKSGYEHNLLQEQLVRRVLHYRVLKDLAESLVLEVVAMEVGIEISEASLAKSAEKIRSMYPEGVFESMLSENVVSERAWMQGLKRRLLTEKLVDRIMEREIAITPEAMKDALLAYSRVVGKKPEEVDFNAELTEKLISRFRRQESEKLYGKWLQEKKESMPVQVHTELLYRVFPEIRPLLAGLGEEEGGVLLLPPDSAPDVDLYEETGL
ncbi:SurA-like protein [Desulfobotulus alkaliphilus]|uniref:SurA-like protein n=1 Tax=Desulfobotulus alkaliphilus TaxID=622671 RepID=A0A562RZM1_9BACT|nr:SurA N-terminal domain-containing protein [Desulfobotulus alkaliphilus]TWI74383.1 SurA-like protein [Desulfobotulus alkaliphilus]